ncbi:glycosyltransferase [Polaromonas sp. P1(28)-8]|nr:glycosyltransferase [Polaromonas sp. P1(28)-8]
MPINGEGFATLFTSSNILIWREKWGRALMAADHIICFSSSSKTLLKRAYPSLEERRVLIIPHAAEERIHWQPRINLSTGLHLGVVGSIGVHKGAAIVQKLADEIAERQLPIRITVFGSIDLPCEPSVVAVTGPYRVEELPLMIEKSGANVFIVPSICPETFSYVTQELMTMNVPVVCFDFGAPAERVGAYDRGLVLPITSAHQLLDDVLEFHCDLVQGRLQNAKL